MRRGRLGGEAGSTDLSAPTNLGQVFFAQTQSKLNELRGANGVFSSDHGRTNGKASGGGASNGHSGAHHSKAESLNPSAQPWVPNSSSPYSYNAATGPDSPRKSMPTWKTQTPIEVFGNNDIDGQGSTRSTSHRYHVGDKSRRNVKEAGPGSSVSAPGSPVRRGFDFGQFVPSPLGLAPVVDGGRPGSPNGLMRTSSLDRETNGAGGGKSSASGFDFSSGPAAQSASTGTADTLFGTEAAGASRSVFSSGANSGGFGAGSMNGANGSSNGSISPTANGASHGRSRSQSAFGGLEGGIGGSPGISNGLHLDKGGFDKGHAGEHADSVRTWSGKDARRAAERAENFRLAKEAALRELRAQLQPQLAVPA